MEDTFFQPEGPAERNSVPTQLQKRLLSEAQLSINQLALPETAGAELGLPSLHLDRYDYHQTYNNKDRASSAADHTYDFHQGKGAESKEELTRGAYKIRKGDTLWTIAERNIARHAHVSSGAEVWHEVRRLANLNHISNPNLIYAGKILKLDATAALDTRPPSSESLSSKQSEPAVGNDGSKSISLSASEIRPAYLDEGIQRSSYEIHSRQEEPYSCSASSMHMALSAYGLRPSGQESRRALLKELEAKGLVSAEHGLLGGALELACELRRHGLEAVGLETRSTAFLEKHLKEGHSAIVNGGRLGRHGSVTGHFVFVYAEDRDGNFIVNDPAADKPALWSRAEMSSFLSRQGRGRRGVAAVWHR